MSIPLFATRLEMWVRELLDDTLSPAYFWSPQQERRRHSVSNSSEQSTVSSGLSDAGDHTGH